jgi:hypothetical protein
MPALRLGLIYCDEPARIENDTNEPGGHADQRVIVRPASFQKQYARAKIPNEPRGGNAARAASANDDIVVSRSRYIC